MVVIKIQKTLKAPAGRHYDTPVPAFPD